MFVIVIFVNGLCLACFVSFLVPCVAFCVSLLWIKRVRVSFCFVLVCTCCCLLCVFGGSSLFLTYVLFPFLLF